MSNNAGNLNQMSRPGGLHEVALDLRRGVVVRVRGMSLRIDADDPTRTSRKGDGGKERAAA